jgi:uncharacterized protein (DUF58 family)
LLVAGLAAGPLVASVVASGAMLRRLRITRRIPAHVFEGERLGIQYALENDRRWAAALAVQVSDGMKPREVVAPAVSRPEIRMMFGRVPPRERGWIRWEGTAPVRGEYRFQEIILATRSPFGLLERRRRVTAPGEIVVYPRVGALNRNWHRLFRISNETRRGRRNERTTRQEDYHGLRDYRPGDSPRWIHWRTSARLGQIMVKEFEHESHQDLVILLDPWQPRSKATPEQRELVERVIRFVASICLESCRHTGRRLVLGTAGPAPLVRQGSTSVKYLHELLGQLAVQPAQPEGHVGDLFDAMPPAILRDAVVVVVSTRPIQIQEEFQRSSRFAQRGSRGWGSRLIVLDASRGDLEDLIDWEPARGAGPASHERLDDGRLDESLAERLGLESGGSHAPAGTGARPVAADPAAAERASPEGSGWQGGRRS